MKNTKINLDRPELTAEEIFGKQNFDTVLASHKFMKKPFYRSSWFMGTAGLASLGLIMGGVLSVQLEPEKEVLNYQLTLVDDEVPPENKRNQINDVLAQSNEQVLEVKYDETPVLVEREEKAYDKKNTLEKVTEIATEMPIIAEKPVAVIESEKVFNRIDLSPRIAGRINGNITREQLLDEKGLVTASNVIITSFELHIIDSSGGHVYVQSGNELNTEMKTALQELEQGQTIYFEKIRGTSGDAQELELNPIRYHLIN